RFDRVRHNSTDRYIWHAGAAGADWLMPVLFRALRHRDFRLYVAGQVISVTGTWVQSLALSWLVYRLTHSALLMGTVGFASQIPVLLLGPIGGLVADRFPRRRIVILMQSLMMVQAAVLAVLTYTGAIHVWMIIVLALVMGTLNAFEIPARQALYVHMVGKDDLANAIALNSMTFNAARVVGPSVGGIFVAAFGEAVCFLINSVSYLAVLACFLLMRTPEPGRSAPPSVLDHLRSGFEYAWNHRPVRALLILTALMNFGSAPPLALGPLFADAIFHRGAQGLGLILGIFGIGAVAGTLALANETSTRKLPGIISFNAIGVAVGLLTYAWAPVFPVILVGASIGGFCTMRQLAATNGLIQTIIDDDFRGRIMALYSMMVIGMLPLGNFAAGAIAEHIGVRWAVCLGGLLVLAAALNFLRARSEVEAAALRQ
ncbi:MAG: MFS transporter, partial [Acidobacteriota bacterium]